MNWYTFGEVCVSPTRYGTILVSASDMPLIDQYDWHVRAGKSLYVRAWLDARRESPMRGKSVYLHDHLMGKSDGLCVDFRNGNGLDCRRENLRFATSQQDACNIRVIRSSSGFLGVGFDKSRGKWRAQIKKDGRNTFIGRFDDLREAVAAYDKAAAETHGEFASTINTDLLAFS